MFTDEFSMTSLIGEGREGRDGAECGGVGVVYKRVVCVCEGECVCVCVCGCVWLCVCECV